ncbi:hypothetical protein E2C01_084826 [Portunus trituberculatus]|uniref:Uncharacterized protein n=1 Tax=Portunus trituberculatus TaxID=210409 RepID=A0A5B7JBY3_PORTR|nr:hypothetical protein [Portunus trituberculatus]
MAKVSKEKSIWRQLCRFHWTPAQIEYIIQLHRELRVQKNWQQVYDRLRRAHITIQVHLWCNHLEPGYHGDM